MSRNAPMNAPELTLASVEAWAWIKSSDYSGRVPDMPRQERDAWSRLSDADQLSRADRALLRALNRKINYRAARELERYPYGYR